MPITPRLKLPYPGESTTPWFDSFKALMEALDAALYTTREDRNILVTGDATVTFNAGTGLLTWDSAIYLLASVTGHRWRIDAGSVILDDGQLAYITVSRAPQSEAAYTLTVSSTTPNEPNGDSQVLLCLRSGTHVHFRDGFVIADGDSLPIFTASGGGGGGPSVGIWNEIIWRPGIASATNHVATWAEVEAFIALHSGACNVYVDDSLAACVVPGTANTECYGAVAFRPFNDVSGASITIADGGRLRNIGVVDFVFIDGTPSAVSPLVFDAGTFFWMENNAGITANGGSAVSMVSVTIDFSIYLLSYSYLSSIPAGVAVIDVAATKTLTLTMEANPNPDGTHTFEANYVSGAVSSTAIISHGDADIFVAQTLFLGTVTEIRQGAARALNPSQGTTAQRPAAPFLGEMYFDTDLGEPIWWNGASWEVPVTLPLPLSDLDPAGATNGDVITRVAGVWTYATPAVTVRPQIIWRPGTASAGDHVATWAEVAAFITLHAGVCDVFVDDSLATCVVTTTQDCYGKARFYGFTGLWAYNVLTIADGAQLTRPGSFTQITVSCAPTSAVAAIALTDVTSLPVFYASILQVEAGTTFPAVDISAASYISFEDGSYFWSAVPTVGIIHVSAAVATLCWISNFKDQPQAITAGSFSGIIGSTLTLVHSAEVYVEVAQTYFLGTFSTTREMQARAIEPSRGTTVQRPYAPKAGEMYWDTDLAAPVWWNGAAWSQTKTSQPQSITWRPGVTSSAGQVATWAEVEAWITASTQPAPLIVYVDDSVATPSVPLTADTDCLGFVWFVASNPIPAYGTTYIEIADGGRLRNIAGLDGVSVYGSPTAVIPLTWNLAAIFYMRGNSWLDLDVGATTALVEVQNTLTIDCHGNNVFINGVDPTYPVIQINAAQTLSFAIRASRQTAALPVALVGGAVGTTLNYVHVDAAPYAAQPLMLGTVNITRLSQASAANPSRGTTGNRPASPVTGEMYFDTTLGYPVWWNGATWTSDASLGLAYSARPAIVWRPGVASAADHVATWAEVEAFIATHAGNALIIVDDSLAPCQVPAIADTECFGSVVFRGYNLSLGSAITILDGGRLRNPGVFDNLSCEGTPTTISPIRLDSGGFMNLYNYSSLRFSGVGATQPMLESSAADAVLFLYANSAIDNFNAPTIPVCHVSGAFAFQIEDYSSENTYVPVVPATFVSGIVGSTITYIHGAGFRIPTQTLVLGTWIEKRLTKSNALDPSRGTTGNRPDTPVTGEMYFDTTLGVALWWTGAAWSNVQPPVAVAAYSIDWSLGSVFSKTLGAGAQVFTFANTTDGQVIIVEVTGAASTLTFTPTITWAGGAQPTQPPSGVGVYTFIKVGATIHGSMSDTSAASVTTVNATPVYVTLATLAAGEVREIDIIAKIAKADGTVRQSFKLSGLFWGNAGTATLDGGSLTDATPRGTGAAVLELDLSGADVRLKITGIAATTLVTTFDASVL